MWDNTSGIAFALLNESGVWDPLELLRLSHSFEP